MTNPVLAQFSPSTDDILQDPTHSNWIKNAVNDLVERDPLDALNDAIELRNVMERRFLETISENGNLVRDRTANDGS